MSPQLTLDYQGHPTREAPFRAAVYRKRMAFTVIVGHARHFRDDFMSWLALNWHVWGAFEIEADRIWTRGRKRYSQRTIWEYLRHQTEIREAKNYHGWKMNDWYVKDCARLYVLLHPDREGFFEFRNGQSAVRVM